jgi:hypothetical protein
MQVQAHQGKPQLYGKIDRTSSFRFSVFHHKTIPYIPGVDLDVPYLSPEVILLSAMYLGSLTTSDHLHRV